MIVCLFIQMSLIKFLFKKQMKEQGISLLTKAYNFAAFKHRNQRRKYGDLPYINHPIQVADFLSQAGVTDINILCAGVLHDTVQDTETTPEQLQQNFNVQIKNYVLQCSDDKNLGKTQRKIYQVQHSKHVSIGAKLVKIADKLNGAPSSWSKQRVFGYHLWSQAVFRNLKGNNEKLDSQLSSIFQTVGVYKLNQQQRQIQLNNYYEILKSKND